MELGARSQRLIWKQTCLQVERRPEVRHLRRVAGSDELARHDADDRCDDAIDSERLAERLYVRAESVSPRRLAQHDYGTGTALPIVGQAKSNYPTRQ